MIPETIPAWTIPLAWIVSAVGFFTLASIQNRNRWLWGVVGLVLPLAAIVAYPLTALTRSDRGDMVTVRDGVWFVIGGVNATLGAIHPTGTAALAFAAGTIAVGIMVVFTSVTGGRDE